MKITDLKTYAVNADWRDWVFVKLFTDEGVTGVGEASMSGYEPAIVAALQGIKDHLLGKDPLNIEGHWHALYYTKFWRGLVQLSAMAGVEQALWDIKGKACGLPVHTLLGGHCREHVRCYTHISEAASGHSLEQRVAEAKRAVEEGWTGLKWNPLPRGFYTLSPADLRFVVEQLRGVREAVGDDVDLMVETHGRLDPATAIQLAHVIAPFKPFFMEEPVPPESLDGLAKVASRVGIPLATGERILTPSGYWPLLERQLVDFIQPDLMRVGGLLTFKKISAMAEARYVGVAPHNSNGPVSTAAALHLAVNLPNFSILEIPADDYQWGARWRDEFLIDPAVVQVRRGHLALPASPGLGLDLDEEAIARYPPKTRSWGVSYQAENTIIG
jgi:galactonate dehydratase